MTDFTVAFGSIIVRVTGTVIHVPGGKGSGEGLIWFINMYAVRSPSYVIYFGKRVTGKVVSSRK